MLTQYPKWSGSECDSLRTRQLLFSRIGLSNLLNKVQFTFEVIPCLILGLSVQTIFSKVCIDFSPVLRGGGWEGGGKPPCR